MLGTVSKPALNAKAKECQGLLAFVVETLESNLDAICQYKPAEGPRARLLLYSGQQALRFDQLLGELPRRIDHGQRHELLAAYMSHVTLFARAGAALKPKAHAMIHMIQRALELGSPRYYHTYRDESLNRVIANIAASSHRMLFATSIFAKFAVMQELGMRNAVT